MARNEGQRARGAELRVDEINGNYIPDAFWHKTYVKWRVTLMLLPSMRADITDVWYSIFSLCMGKS